MLAIAVVIWGGLAIFCIVAQLIRIAQLKVQLTDTKKQLADAEAEVGHLQDIINFKGGQYVVSGTMSSYCVERKTPHGRIIIKEFVYTADDPDDKEFAYNEAVELKERLED